MEAYKTAPDHLLMVEWSAAVEKKLAQVKLERIRQLGKWGWQIHDPERWLAILGEEFGEVCKDVLTWTTCGTSGVETRKAYENCQKELIQVAAVALAFAQALDNQDKAV